MILLHFMTIKHMFPRIEDILSMRQMVELLYYND